MPGLDQIGIRFREVMSGFVAAGASDPVKGFKLGEQKNQPFFFDLVIDIARLQPFLDDPGHRAQIPSGSVRWSGRNVNILPGGSCAMFRADPGSRKRKYFDFNFSFPDGNEVIRVEGHKYLFDDHDFDVAADMSMIHLVLDRGGQPAGAGIVQVTPLEFLRQMDAMEAPGAADASEKRSAIAAFYGFMNQELREVYDGLPLVMRQPGKLTLEEWRALVLCARIMLPDPLPADGPSLDETIANLERYVALADEPQLEQIRGWLGLVGIIAPLIDGDLPGLRTFVRKQLASSTRTPLRDALEMVHSMVVFPYYSHPKADRVTGYRRPEKLVPANPAQLPVSREIPDFLFDVVIAGSGPAGTLLAQRLTRQGKQVLLLEAGPYVPESSIGPDEIDATARLYKRAAFQRANDPELFGPDLPSFMVLQGSCVGGGGVVNNAVCFRMPDRRVGEWGALGFPLSVADLKRGYDAVGNDLGIGPLGDKAEALNPAVKLLAAGLGMQPRKPDAAKPPEPGLYECLVNMRKFDPVTGQGCRSSGLCNLACSTEGKTNGLQVYLPEAVRNGCVVVPDASVVSLACSRPTPGSVRQVEAMLVRVGDSKTLVRARGLQYVLCAGPIGSSAILLRSPVIRDWAESKRVPIGKRLSANVGSPVFAFGAGPVSEKPAVQIAHYVVPDGGGKGFVVESWYNPPGANAMALPGYFEDHFNRMRQYGSTVAAAPLVGSEAKGSVTLRGDAERIQLPFGKYELERLREGVGFLARAFLKGGASSVLSGAGSGTELRSESDVAAFEASVKSIHKLRVGTGHPQGGNAMSNDRIGVLDDQFRVKGVANLRVCDGSIFPDSSEVNPQWTIMALAHCCAERMA